MTFSPNKKRKKVSLRDDNRRGDDGPRFVILGTIGYGCHLACLRPPLVDARIDLTWHAQEWLHSPRFAACKRHGRQRWPRSARGAHLAAACISPRRAGVAAGHRQAPARRPFPPFQSGADPPRAAVADIRTAYRRQALVSRNCVPQTPRCRPSCVRLTNTRRSTPLRRPVCLLTSGTACLQKWHPDKLELRGGRGRPSSGEGGSQGAIPAAADGVRRWRVPFDFLYTCVCVNRIRWICIADGESLIRGSAVGRLQEGGVRPGRRRRLPVRVRSGGHGRLG